MLINTAVVGHRAIEQHDAVRLATNALKRVAREGLESVSDQGSKAVVRIDKYVLELIDRFCSDRFCSVQCIGKQPICAPELLGRNILAAVCRDFDLRVCTVWQKNVCGHSLQLRIPTFLARAKRK